MQQLHEEHEAVKAKFGKLAEARKTLDSARVELEALEKLGDLVTPEDVIKGAGKLVAAGLSPMAVAKLLSDMPEQGQQLQSWIAQHAEGLATREAQLEPVLAQVQHALGVAGMRALIGHAVAGDQGGSSAPPSLASPEPLPQPPMNPLSGGPPNAG